MQINRCKWKFHNSYERQPAKYTQKHTQMRHMDNQKKKKKI